MSRCAYCGSVARLKKTTCDKHADLPALDQLSRREGSRHNYRSWWRERYTLAELRDLAAGLIEFHPRNNNGGHRQTLDSHAPVAAEGAKHT